MPKVKRKLKIVEAIPKKGNPGQEKPILDEFLKMFGLRCESLAVDNRKKGDNLLEAPDCGDWTTGFAKAGKPYMNT